ncbi:MAG: type II toxin-antitoxin system VapC family toxin [Desulfococcaceae bacterium]|jgi:PIN domain nuclease of toxin-antitoxin system|nr:type II toxin-antitoxin system VapC family toxin [Desulfococcaceae bacterium]
MKILLDTHILLWHLADDPRLEISKSELIENSSYSKYLSIISLWEIAIKSSLGKLIINTEIDKIVPEEIKILGLEMPHILAVQTLPFHHRDPFDRMIIAQAMSENMTVMTGDKRFGMYDVELVQQR